MGCVRLDILDDQYYRTEFKEPTSISLHSEASKNHEEQRNEYLAAEKVGAAAEIIFSAKTFSFGSFSFWSQKENERYFIEYRLIIEIMR